MSQTHLGSQCCQILCMHQCAIHECVGAQMFWNTLRHRLFSPLVVSSQNVPAATKSFSPPLPVTRETPLVQQPVTPHVDVQPEFPPPASSADDDPMPFPHVDDSICGKALAIWHTSSQESCIEALKIRSLHPETPVPTTTSPQLRWRSGVLRALRPFRRLRETQSDPSERVKRSRLAPGNILTGLLDLMKEAPCLMEPRIGATRFFLQDVRQGKRSILLPNLQRISFCCLRPWNLNGRNGRSTRQHYH